MPAAALCLSDHGSRIGGAWRAPYICQTQRGGLVLTARSESHSFKILPRNSRWLLAFIERECLHNGGQPT